MILFPNCKINIGLRVAGRRTDGYHDLHTVFYPIPLKDALEIVQCQPPCGEDFSIDITGNSIPGENGDNLCRRAWQLLKTDFPSLPPIRTFLHKSIPIGAGLGGGSSNGAHTLLLLNEKFGLGLTRDRLASYALELGSDCPFFIYNKPCYALGRGEKMEEIQLNLAAYHIALVNPGIHVSTGWAFNQLNPAVPSTNLKELILHPVETWKDNIFNDFEPVVFNKYPDIRAIKERLYAEGALFASMTGTGSTVFGIFPRKPEHLQNIYRDYTLIIL